MSWCEVNPTVNNSVIDYLWGGIWVVWIKERIVQIDCVFRTADGAVVDKIGTKLLRPNCHSYHIRACRAVDGFDQSCHGAAANTRYNNRPQII